MRILGLDPGSLKTGFGVLEYAGSSYNYVASGLIRMPAKDHLPARLKVIAQGIDELIAKYQPDVAAIEDVFFAHNPKSTLKLGQARGAAITAVVRHDIDVQEYAAKLIKQAVASNGSASKDQVQFMVKNILNIKGELKEDASDALAVAICHAHHAGVKG